MIVANSFDLWQKDTFFSAAEEVQTSADILESVFRKWVRERREGLACEDWDELCRELQRALGTSKWQLEEFDKAVRLSHRSRSEDNTTFRHRQFVAAIESQISRIEAAITEYFNQNGNQHFQWVNLDEQERDDLALFLTGTSGTLPTIKLESVAPQASTDNCVWNNEESVKDITANKDRNHIIELEAREIPGTRDDMNSQSDRSFGSRRMWSSPNFGALKILIPGIDEQKKTLSSTIEAKISPKEKVSKPAFWNWNQWCRAHALTRGRVPSCIQLGGISRTNQLFGRFGVFQRQVQSPQHLQFNCSVQVMLVLMLTMFLIGKNLFS